MKEGLLQRERRLSAYRFEAVSEEGGEQAILKYAYRAPNRMRVDLLGAEPEIFAFDGSSLVHAAKGKVESVALPESAPQRAELLARIFGPPVPFGFRAPLLSLETAELSRPEGNPRLVELTQQLPDSARVTYRLRLPHWDFVSRTLSQGQQVRQTRMETEHCEKDFCVPTTLSEWENGKRLLTLRLRELELSPKLPESTFALPLL